MKNLIKLITDAKTIIIKGIDIPTKKEHERLKEVDRFYIKWLFDNVENINEFGEGMTEEQKESLAEFEKYIGL